MKTPISANKPVEAWAVVDPDNNYNGIIDVYDSEQEARNYAALFAGRTGIVLVNGKVVRSFDGGGEHKIIRVRIEQVAI